MNSEKNGLDASALKYIAIFAMFIDHTASLFVPVNTVVYTVMRFIGRSTLPIMAFFIVEGYHHTKNLRKYYIRMIVFAVISHFAFAFCFAGGFFAKAKSSVITTLTLCLLSVDIVNNPKIKTAYKMPLILIIAFLSEECDWGMNAVIFTLAFELARGDKKDQCKAYAIAAAWYCLPLLTVLRYSGLEMFLYSLSRLGVFVPALLLMSYNGEKGGGKYTKWVFYIFYPLHMLLLGYVNNYLV